MSSAVSAAPYEAFDTASVLAELATRHGDDEAQLTLAIDGIRCANCSLSIEKAIAPLDGVRSIQVNPATRLGNLSWDPQRIRLSEIMGAMADLGFEPHPLRRDTRSRLHREEYRAALRRLIVAGFGMMQVMTFAVATYAGAFDGISSTFLQFFRLISLLIATPVVFYSAAPFFRAAARDLGQRRVGMDVPVALAIGIAYSVSVAIVFFGSEHTEVYFDSVVMFTFFLSCGRFAEMLARHRTLAANEALAGSLPATALRICGNADDGWPTEHVVLSELRPDDRVLVRAGDTVPTDGTVVSGESAVDESLLTGESTPRTRRAGDAVIGGSVNVSGPLHVEVTRIGADTMLSGIARLLERAQGERPRMAHMADTIAGWFVAGVLTVAAIVCMAWLYIDPARALTVTLSVLVVTCPCALSLATPAAITAATGFLSRRGLLVTRGSALETLARADTLLLDKTGTLTHGQLEVADVIALRNGADAIPASDCLSIAAALEANSAHPIALALSKRGSTLTASDVREHAGSGIEGKVDGRHYRIGAPDFVNAQRAARTHKTHAAATHVYLGDEDGPLAVFALADSLRPDASTTLEALRGRGFSLAILSGDQPAAVAAIAGELGIDDYAAGLLPEDKLAELRRRRELGATIAMLGDGINDAPVLAGADVSIAMGSGSSLAHASADLVLLGTTLDTLVTGVDHGRRTLQIVRQNLTWAVAYNIVALPLAAAGLVAPWMAALGMSASSLIVVLNALRLGRDDDDSPVLPEGTIAPVQSGRHAEEKTA